MPNKQCLTRVLANVVMKQYPRGIHVVSYEELFSWPLWVTCLKMGYSSCSSFPAEPSHLKWFPIADDDFLLRACSHALLLLEEEYNIIVLGKITIQELNTLMEKHEKQLCKLCDAASSTSLRKDLLIKAMEKHKSEYVRLTQKVCQLQVYLSNFKCHDIIEGELICIHISL